MDNLMNDTAISFLKLEQLSLENIPPASMKTFHARLQTCSVTSMGALGSTKLGTLITC